MSVRIEAKTCTCEKDQLSNVCICVYFFIAKKLWVVAGLRQYCGRNPLSDLTNTILLFVLRIDAHYALLPCACTITPLLRFSLLLYRVQLEQLVEAQAVAEEDGLASPGKVSAC